MFMGFTLHYYIIFGTNLLTGGRARIAVFLPISMFRRKGISNESKQNETFASVIFGTNVIQRTWSGSQETREAATRVPGGPLQVGTPPTLVDSPGLFRPNSFTLGASLVHKKHQKMARQLDSVWYPFSAILTKQPQHRNWH